VCHGVRASPLDAPEGSGGGLIGASLQIGERINKEARRWIGGVRTCITSVALSHLGLSCRDRNPMDAWPQSEATTPSHVTYARPCQSGGKVVT